MRNCVNLAWIVLLVIVCYSAFQSIGILHHQAHKRTRTNRNHRKEEPKKWLRPWEQCETAQRYVFLKKHKVASR